MSGIVAKIDLGDTTHSLAARDDPGPMRIQQGEPRRHGNVDPTESARHLLDRVDQLKLETTGRFWYANGQELPW